MQYVIGAFLILHGIPHLVGFTIPFRLVNLEEAPYKTTILGGRIDLGDYGIRVMGLLWLAGAIGFLLAGVGLMLGQPWWQSLTLYVSLASFVISVLGWPDSRIGLIINVVIILYLIFGGDLGWLPATQ